MYLFFLQLGCTVVHHTHSNGLIIRAFKTHANALCVSDDNTITAFPCLGFCEEDVTMHRSPFSQGLSSGWITLWWTESCITIRPCNVFPIDVPSARISFLIYLFLHQKTPCSAVGTSFDLFYIDLYGSNYDKGSEIWRGSELNTVGRIHLRAIIFYSQPS